MKALSVKQPWAHFLVTGKKTIENRTWVPGRRLKEGEALLIHASGSFDLKGYRWILEFREQLGLSIDEIPARDEFDLGAIVGAVTFGEVVEESESQWFFGPKGWVITDALPMAEPIPCKGRLGLWNAEEALAWNAAEKGSTAKTQRREGGCDD